MIKSYGFWHLTVDDRYYRELYKNNKEEYKNYLYNTNRFYSLEQKRWVNRSEYLTDGHRYHFFPSPFLCHSLKAAKRHLRKHNEIPKGTRFVLVSRYIGCDIHLIKK